MLVVDRLVNLLVGRDFGVFSLMPRDEWERHKIDILLKMIETSDVTFIRNNEELTGAVFAEHLRQKREHLFPGVVSVDQFIDQVASRSSLSGSPYQVKLPDGQILDVATWLPKQAIEIGPDDETTEKTP